MLSDGGVCAPGKAGVLGTAGRGDTGLGGGDEGGGGVCPGATGAFCRRDAVVTIGRMMPATRPTPEVGAGNGDVLAGVDEDESGSADVTASAISFVGAAVLGALSGEPAFCFSAACPAFTEVNSMVVLGMMTGGISGLVVFGFCCAGVAAGVSGVSLPVPAALLALSFQLLGLIGVDVCGASGTWGTSGAREAVMVWPSLNGRTRLISGWMVRFSPPVGVAGAVGTGVPQILQKRASATSSLLHFEQRFISCSHAPSGSTGSYLSSN